LFWKYSWSWAREGTGEKRGSCFAEKLTDFFRKLTDFFGKLTRSWGQAGGDFAGWGKKKRCNWHKLMTFGSPDRCSLHYTKSALVSIKDYGGGYR
jgi:hypothetical protein